MSRKKPPQEKERKTGSGTKELALKVGLADKSDMWLLPDPGGRTNHGRHCEPPSSRRDRHGNIALVLA